MSMVVVGSVFVDIKGYPLGAYIPGGRNAGTVETVHGGVARNIAEDIANMGLHPVFVSLVDDNGTGADVLARLEGKMDVRYVRRCESGMGTWLAIFDEHGDVTAAISRRPDLRPLADILDENGDAIFAEADCVLLELDLEPEVVQRVYALAERYHTPVYAAVSNMSIGKERKEYLPKTACFVCNEQEAGILFDEPVTGDPEAYLRRHVQAWKLPGMVVTLGEKGAVYATIGGESGRCEAQKVTVKDTGGAGDSFFAGFCVGLHKGFGWEKACRLGTRLAATVIVTRESVCPPGIEPEV